MTTIGKGKAALRCGFFLLASIAISGCVTHVADVALTSVDRPDPGEPLSVARDRDLISHPDALRLRFTSATDFAGLARDKDSFMVGVLVSFCPLDDNQIVGLGDVYWRGRNVSDWQLAALKEEKSASGIYEYESFFRYRAVLQISPSRHSSVTLPLPTEPQDLCFKVRGPTWPVPNGFESNVVEIPKDAVMRALAQSSNAKP